MPCLTVSAFVFVMPEYNYGFSAPLKNAIDYLYTEWQYKPVGFVSYGMASGGLRAVQVIKQVVTTLKMMPANEAVTVFLRGPSTTPASWCRTRRVTPPPR